MIDHNLRLDRSKFEKVLKQGNLSDLAVQVENSLNHSMARRDIDWLWNQIKKRSDLFGIKPIKILLFSSFTLNLLEAPLGLQMVSHERLLDIEFVPYQQWEMELHQSGLINEQKVAVVQILLHLEDEIPALGDNLSTDREVVSEQLSGFIERLRAAIHAFRKNSQIPIILNSFIDMQSGIERFSSMNIRDGRHLKIDKLNVQIAKLCKEYSNIYIYDYANLVSEIGRNNWFDIANYYHTISPISSIGVNLLAQDLSNFYRALFQTRVKVLIVDLDNTLWGGIAGEDGATLLSVKDGYLGKSFRSFQSTIKGLKETGIVLAIASKNNEEDAKEVFDVHPDMPLKWEDFVVTRINWSDKSTNIIDIASTIGVGLDSVVFVDDNPLECERVKNKLPEVKVVLLEGEPHTFSNRLLNAANLYPLKLTDEDKIRTDYYHSQRLRGKLKEGSTDENEFLSSLGLVVEIGLPELRDYDRVVQLINKTNQFNLTTKRYQLNEVIKILNSPDTKLSVVKAKDKFGNYGLIGVQILRFSNSICIIDTFLMSCRILGRNIEDSILLYLKKVAQRGKAKKLIGQFTPTKKNVLVVDFYINSGFSPIADSTEFEFDLMAERIESYPNYLTIRELEPQ